jgi:hypothetical protein
MTDRSGLKHSTPHPELLPGLRSAALSVESIASTPAVAALRGELQASRRGCGEPSVVDESTQSGRRMIVRSDLSPCHVTITPRRRNVSLRRETTLRLC